MELSGKIFKVMPLETGEGKNGVWKKAESPAKTFPFQFHRLPVSYLS